MRDNIYSAMADDIELCVGDLYECLDVCNRHHSGILEIKKEHWLLHTSDREHGGIEIEGIFSSESNAWKCYDKKYPDENGRYYNIGFVQEWINDKKVSE